MPLAPAWVSSSGSRSTRPCWQAPIFRACLATSVLWTVGNVVFVLAIGMVTALMLDRRFPARSVVRALFILPWAIPYVAAALIWGWIFDYEFGVLNYLAVATGIGSAQAQLSAGLSRCPRSALPACRCGSCFRSERSCFSPGSRPYRRNTTKRPRSTAPAALQTFRYVTLPGVRNVTIMLTLLITIWTFGRTFTIIFLLTEGGPAGCTENIVIRSYLEAFKFFHIGTASALGVIVLAISLVFSVGLPGLRLSLELGAMPELRKLKRWLWEAAFYRARCCPSGRRRLSVLLDGQDLHGHGFGLCSPIRRAFCPAVSRWKATRRWCGKRRSDCGYGTRSWWPRGRRCLRWSRASPAPMACPAFAIAAKGPLALVILTTQMMPPLVLIIPLYTIFIGLGLTDTLFGLILGNFAFSLPVVMWMMKSIFDSIPDRNRGGGPRRRRVLALHPVSASRCPSRCPVWWRPASSRSSTAGTSSCSPGRLSRQPTSGWEPSAWHRSSASTSPPWDQILAAATIFTLPPVILFLLVQKYFIAGLGAGAVKG